MACISLWRPVAKSNPAWMQQQTSGRFVRDQRQDFQIGRHRGDGLAGGQLGLKRLNELVPVARPAGELAFTFE